LPDRNQHTSRALAHRSADDKDNARLIVSQVIIDTMSGLKMSYPETTKARRRNCNPYAIHWRKHEHKFFSGKAGRTGILVNVPRLITAYYTEKPDPSVPAQRVAFGTSGHRGSSFNKAFNEYHILAITQAICIYRKLQEPMAHCFWN